MSYHHTQRGKLHWLLLPLGFVMLGCALAFRAEMGTVGAYFLAGGAAVTIVLAYGFRDLTVRDEGGTLVIEFGPIPVWRRSVPMREITAAETARSTLLDGWGIHYMPGQGWIYNVWGYDCVRIKLGDGQLRVGTDDPEGLTAYLNDKLE